MIGGGEHRLYAANERTKASRLTRAGHRELAEHYRMAARLHEEAADRMDLEAGVSRPSASGPDPFAPVVMLRCPPLRRRGGPGRLSRSRMRRPPGGSAPSFAPAMPVSGGSPLDSTAPRTPARS